MSLSKPTAPIMQTTMRIGELAQATGVEVETIRYYEKAGLLAGPARGSNGYRAYGAVHQDRLGFIRHCRALDISLDEIRALLRFKDAPQANCEEVNELLDQHIVHVAERISQLQGLEKQLRKLRAQCKKVRTAADCGILHELAHPIPHAGGANRHAGHVPGAHAQVRKPSR